MSNLLFSSGTSGNKQKAIIFSNEEIKTMRKAMGHFWDLCPCGGITLNIIPAFPNLGFHFAKIYEEFSLFPTLSTGGIQILGVEKHLNLIQELKPTMIIGTEDVVKELIEFSKKEGLINLKIVVIANGISEEAIEWFKERNIEIRATYGFSEARMAWLTGKDYSKGYFIYKDCGVSFKNSDDGELIFYSKNYPDGYLTGDIGRVTDYEDYQIIDFLIKRKDGKSKKIIGCNR